MAMAEVYLPEMTEDALTAYPRAPPPSPEMQPRPHSQVFEIPASKFDGIGLDLRTNSFPLDEEDECPLGGASFLSGAGYESPQFHGGMGYESPRFLSGTGYESSGRYRDCDDDSLACSPLKRVCCSPCTLPSDFLTTSFPSSSNQDSVVSSGFGSYQLPLHGPMLDLGRGSGMATGFHNSVSHSCSDSPCLDSRRRPHESSPPHFGAETLTGLHPLPPADHAHLSRSYDLHSMHPHLPRSFETTQLPEVRQSRSRTLDSNSIPPHLPTLSLDAGYGEDPNQRRRKISVKRKNPDEDDEEDPNLQFSFEYSYSSTGSSGESDWVMVDCKMGHAWPMGKKTCCADDPSSIAIRQELEVLSLQATPPYLSGGGRVFVVPPPGPLESLSTGNVVGFSPFSDATADQRVTTPIDRVATPTNQCSNLESVTMMDCEGRLGSMDGMDCDTGDTLVLRAHDRDNPLPYLARHSCADAYLQQPLRGQGFSGGAEVTMCGGDMDVARLNLSKSL